MKPSKLENQISEKKPSWQNSEAKKSYNLCVTCMRKGKFKGVHDKNHNYGKPEVYSQMLSYCFSFRIAEEKECGKVYYICDTCISKLRSASKFRKQIEIAQNKYKTLYHEFALKYSPEKKRPRMVSESDSEGRYEDLDEPDSDSSEEPNKNVETEYDNVLSDEQNVENAPVKLEDSPVTGRGMDTRSKKAALKTKVGSSDLPPIPINVSPSKEQFPRCPTCYESFRSPDELARHARIHDAAIYPGPEFPQLHPRQIKKSDSPTQTLPDEYVEEINRQLKSSMRDALDNMKKERDDLGDICEEGDIILVVQESQETQDEDEEENKDSDADWDENAEQSDAQVGPSEPKKKYKRWGGLYACLQCPYTTLRCSCLRAHLLKHDKNKPFLCELCAYTCNTMAKLRLHQLIHSVFKPYKCEHCPYASRYPADLAVHRRAHTDFRPYTCETCGKCFRRSKHLKAHQTTHGDPRKYECDKCDFATKSPLTIKRHTANHNHDKRMTCSYCGKVFPKRSDLTIHRVTEHDVLIKRERVVKSGSHRCGQCSRSFDNVRNLVKHKSTHSEEKPYACDKCDVTFKKKTYMYKHRLIHSSVKPFTCSQCPFASVRAADLRTHFRKHSNLRPFPCPSCPMRFKKKDTLTRHLVTHSDLKPYLCTLCGFKCKTSEALKRHIRLHEGPKLACDSCDYTCQEGRQLVKHRLKHAQDKTEEGPVVETMEGEDKTVMVQWVWDE